MPAFVSFVQRLLTEGRVVLSEPPAAPDADELQEAATLLRQAFDAHALDVAGPPPDFDADAACRAAEQVWLACWFLLSRGEEEDEVARRLPEPTAPTTPAQHLSADVALRFLPQVLHRARALAAGDVLTAWLTRLLRTWPLSGVLADIDEGPLTPTDFGHDGLRLLYAERLAERPRPAWLPTDGPTREAVELAFAERGRTL